MLKYVSSEDKVTLEARAKEWGEYVRLMSEWVKLSRELETCFRELGEAQADEP